MTIEVPGKSYVVGGAVRDDLLGVPVSDRDHVVVGATVEAMAAAGFRAVGRDFPVFLHPATQEEYALARTERKVARGYRGFVFDADPSVTLADDLARRDLTINAMARDDVDGALVDPFGGRRDLAARVLRHVGPAFAEDPVRVLRLARFAARFADFVVAPETMALVASMVDAGEADALVPERVWRELARGLMEASPVRMLDVLRTSGALARVLPELDGLPAASVAAVDRALVRSAAARSPLDVRFAVLMHAAAGDDVSRASARLAVPRDERDLAVLVAREREAAWSATSAVALADILERTDALRRPARFARFVDAAMLIDEDDERRAARGDVLDAARRAAGGIDARAIAAAAGRGDVPARIREARTTAIDAALGRR